MRQCLHRLWKCLGLNTRRLGTSRAFAVPANRRLRLRRSTPTCSLQYSSAAVRARSLSVAISDLALTSTSSACAPRSVPPFAYPFRFFPSPSLSCPRHRPRFRSHFSLPAPSHCSLPTHCPTRRFINAGWRCLPSHAQPVQTRAWPCSAGPNLPVRCLASVIGSAHGLAIQQAHTSPPILPSSSPLFPSSKPAPRCSPLDVSTDSRPRKMATSS
ncbi:hypothetical protein DFH08DRAFT_1079781 [Mycena albidolilacea]|uniref:Uncharacterized protein n=1 Tax=Mycena albidolilacea TaxID=1033008 RepID=A0AAD7A2F3_9AGAR|nr:hypothetical protein DFH08DRAFT_1079781 [Mycena albidolilacea]